MHEEMNFEVEPAWKFIPQNVTVSDLRELANELWKEAGEVVEAVNDYSENQTGKNMAHIGEELADVITRAGTCFAAIERMKECPIEDFTNACMQWVVWKNEARGYHND